MPLPLPQAQPPADPVGESKSSRRRRKKRAGAPHLLYEQYLADSGSDKDDDLKAPAAEDEEAAAAFGDGNFAVGMDINILIRQTVQNVIQSVCLEGAGRSAVFGDHDMMCFAAAVKHNSTILSIQIKYLGVTDLSLVPLCHALSHHPTLRALDICGTQGSTSTGAALRQLVCINPSIIFAPVDGVVMTPADADIVTEAVQYNAMVCPDPSSNPFQLGLLRKFSAIEEQEKHYMERLAPRAWLLEPTGRAAGGSCSTAAAAETVEASSAASSRAKGKHVGWRTSTSTIGAEVCPQYLRGSCSYGSRCKYFHPEYTAALSNAVQMHQLAEHHAPGGDAASTVISAATSAGGSRLQSRLRPSHFTLHRDRLEAAHRRATETLAAQQVAVAAARRRADRQKALGIALWSMSGTVLLCSAAITALLL
eukprot:gene1154-680_t